MCVCLPVCFCVCMCMYIIYKYISIHVSSTNARLGYSRKNPNRGVEDMEFSGILKKEHAEIPGVN